MSDDGKFTTIDVEKEYYKKQKGRPSSYNYDWVKTIYDEYISEYTKEKYLKLEKSFSSSSVMGEELERNSQSEVYERKLYIKVPGETSFARYLGIATSTLFEWKEKYPEFGELMTDLLEVQKDFLLDGSISGRLNPLIAKLLLSKHGITDESTVKVSGTLNLSEFFDKKPKDNLISE